MFLKSIFITKYLYEQIHDGPSESTSLLARLCGNSVPVPVESSQNFMWIHFYTDPLIGGSGFSASYTTQYTGFHKLQN